MPAVPLAPTEALLQAAQTIPTEPLASRIDSALLKDLLVSPSLNYSDISDSVLCRPPIPHALPGDDEIYNAIVTPYNAKAFETALKKHNISHEFPYLVKNLTEGFPIAVLPELTRTIIIPNHPSVMEHPEVVREYLDKELAAGRMSGPYSQEETERILRGPFYSSPLIVAEQDEGPEEPPKYRVCRHLSKGDKVSGIGSVNSFVEKELFPTHFDMASKVADTVRLSHIYDRVYPWSWSVFVFVLVTVSCPCSCQCGSLFKGVASAGSLMCSRPRM